MRSLTPSGGPESRPASSCRFTRSSEGRHGSHGSGPSYCPRRASCIASRRMLKVLVVHDRYTQPGGEDEVVAAETAMLRRHGHEVGEFTEDNRRGRSMSRLRLAVRTIWSAESQRAIAGIVRRERPDVAHFHNTFPLVSPSAYYACREAGIPVVQTVHNYRIVCPNALLLRDGHPCVKCVGRAMPWPGVRHACYHDSVAQSAVIAA